MGGGPGGMGTNSSLCTVSLGEGVRGTPGPRLFPPLKVTDLAQRRRGPVDPWVVRRAMDIVVLHREHLDLEDLTATAMALLMEAEARMSGKDPWATR